MARLRWDAPHGPDYALDELEFMAAYGRAMAAWGSVEHAMARIYIKLLRPSNIEHAAKAYFSVLSFRDRSNATSSLVNSNFGTDKDENPTLEAVEWARIIRKVNES